MNRITLLVLLGFFIISCSKSDDNGIITDNSNIVQYLPYKWKILHHLDENWLSRIGTNHGNMVFKDKVLITVAKNENHRCLALIDSEDGSVLWEWDDWYQPATETGNFTNDVRYDNYLFWVNGTRRYVIDMETGETVRKFRDDELSFYFRYKSKNDTVYLIAKTPIDNDFSGYTLFKGNIFDESIPQILTVPYNPDSIGSNGLVKSIDHVELYKNEHDFYYVITSSQPYSNWEHDIRLNLYNESERKWVYQDYLVAKRKQNNGGWKMIFEDKIFMSCGKEFFCFDILSGQKVWEREFAHDFVFSGFEIVDDVIIANCEDKNLYGIEPSTGQILWTGEGAGTSSRLYDRIMNGVVYFKGGSSGYFHAVDIHTGKTLWKLDPYKYEENNAYWTANVNIVQGKNGKKGKVIIQNALNTYCFEAAK